VTLYTRYREYPYPRDAKEAGNGGLHSQMLAEAVQQDLDALDAAWTLETQRPTLMAVKSGDQTIGAGLAGQSINAMVVERQVGITMINAGFYRAKPGGEGWYHVLATVRSKATGTITAGALHQIELKSFKVNATGNLDYLESRFGRAFQSGSADVYTEVQDLIYIDQKTEVRFQFGHNNAGSSVAVVGSGTGGTRITLTRIVGA
jgi:hypothetical protein